MLIYWLLPMILSLGIVTSYEDLKHGKIRNKWIILAIAYSIVINVILFLLNYQDFSYLTRFSVNGLLSLLVGFAIWQLSLWTAGDAKLFFAFATLIPIYQHDYFFFLSFLLNAFIPISLIFLIQVIFKTSGKEKLSNFKKTFSAKSIFSLIFFIFGFFWISKLLLNLFGFESNILLSFFSIFLFYHLIERVLKIKILYISLLLSLLRLIFDNQVYSFEFIKEFSILLLLFLMIRIFIVSLSFRFFTKKVKFSELKERMIPAEIIFRFKGKYIRRPLRKSVFGFGAKKKIGRLLFKKSPQGLSKEDISRLKKLKSRLPFKTLKVQMTMPFAPFLFLGALLTIIFQGSIINLFF